MICRNCGSTDTETSYSNSKLTMRCQSCGTDLLPGVDLGQGDVAAQLRACEAAREENL